MTGKQAAEMVRNERKLFLNLIQAFAPEDGAFRPKDGMMNVAQQVHHVAFTVKWFREGAFGAGFNLDFAMLENENKRELTLEQALADLNVLYDDYIAFLEDKDEADLMAPMPPNPIFGEMPRMVTLVAQGEHTAHHRGSLAVYLRLLDKVPPMIYS